MGDVVLVLVCLYCFCGVLVVFVLFCGVICRFFVIVVFCDCLSFLCDCLSFPFCFCDCLSFSLLYFFVIVSCFVCPFEVEIVYLFICYAFICFDFSSFLCCCLSWLFMIDCFSLFYLYLCLFVVIFKNIFLGERFCFSFLIVCHFICSLSLSLSLFTVSFVLFL